MASHRPKPNQQRKKERQSLSCFFKVMVGDFPNKCRVPPAFVKNFKGSSFPTVVRLRSPYVDSPVSWRVKMKEKDGGLYITRGWKQIVRDLDLKLADFLIFQLVSEEALRVVVYAPTGCEKKIHIGVKQGTGGEADDERFGGVQVKAEEVIDITSEGSVVEGEEEDEECIDIGSEDSDVEEEEGGGGSVAAVGRAGLRPSTASKKRYPFVKKSLVKHDIIYFTIPLAVAWEAGQWTKTSALIRDCQGQEWPVGLRSADKRSPRRDISAGWCKFIRDNGLSVGDTLRLEFQGGRTNLIKARVLRRASRQ